jgi:hypothetical protein
MYPIENYVDTSEYVIIAHAVKVEQREGAHYNGINATLKVTKIYKGGLKKDEIIEFAGAESDCSFRFEENKNYLLFCFRSNNKFCVYDCSYSDEVGVSIKNIRKIEKYINKHYHANSLLIKPGRGNAIEERAFAGTVPKSGIPLSGGLRQIHLCIII